MAKPLSPHAVPARLDDPVAVLLQRATLGRRHIVGLVGLPGAGKSTLAQRWCSQVNAARRAQGLPPTMQTLGMDGFHLSRARLSAMPNPAEALARRGAEWTFDPAALRAHLQALRQSHAPTLTWPDFDHEHGDPVEAALCVPASSQLILVEGLYLLLPDADWSLKPLFDEVWFLDTSPAQAQQQLVQRHMRVWGWDEARARERAQASDALNAQRVWSTRAFADAWVQP